MIKANTFSRGHRLQSSGGTCSETLKCCIPCHSLTKPPSMSAAPPLVCSKRAILLGGASLLLSPLLSQQASAKPNLLGSADSISPSFNGFDGVGGTDADYANAELREIAVGNGGGVASVHVDGFEQLMPIFIGVAEAAALVYATTGGEGSRPSTLGTWRRSLEATGSKVERVVITRLENHTYYSRIVLSLPDGVKRSIDSRPSDSLALALQCEAPLFVARQLALEQQEPTIDDALEGLEDLDPENVVTPQEAGMRKSGGLQAVQPTPAKPLMVTAVGMQDMEDFHLKLCTIV
ncbi:hypothetical protein ABBQ38_009249 [Trebouxia sp. C0009 RCD-2024]